MFFFSSLFKKILFSVLHGYACVCFVKKKVKEVDTFPAVFYRLILARGGDVEAKNNENEPPIGVSI